MTYPTGRRSIYQKDRLFDPLLTIITLFDAIGIATRYILGQMVGRPGDQFALEASQSGLWILFPYMSPMIGVVQNIVPDRVDIIFSHTFSDKDLTVGEGIYGFKSINMGLVTALYVEFYEKHAPCLKQTFGGDGNAWPPLFNFARVIRNFIVHHGGKVHFDNQNAPSVTWHHLTYSPADEGKQAVGHSYITVGDMIVLLVEFSDELDKAGCPLVI